MLMRSARLGILTLGLALMAAPALAQDDGDTGQEGAAQAADTSKVTRTWEIYLKSGQRIAFTGQMNWGGAAKGPGQFLSDYQAYVAGGSLPPISRYSFPAKAGSTDPAADIVIDLREVIAVVQKF